MARYRTIKPEFCDDVEFGNVSRDVRLFFILMLPFSDDYGVILGDARWLKSKIFPYDEDISAQKIEKFLQELKKMGKVLEFFPESTPTIPYYFIKNFLKHQKIEKPSERRNPAPPLDILNNSYVDNSETVGNQSATNRQPIGDKVPPLVRVRVRKENIKRKNINTKKEKEKITPPPKTQKLKEAPEPKKEFAPLVELTETEHTTLTNKHGTAIVAVAIEALSAYKQAHGKKYKSDYGALRSWAIGKAIEQENKALVPLPQARGMPAPTRKLEGQVSGRTEKAMGVIDTYRQRQKTIENFLEISDG